MSRRNIGAGAWALLNRVANGNDGQPWPVPATEREYVASLRQHGYVRRVWHDTQDIYIATAAGRRALQHTSTGRQESEET